MDVPVEHHDVAVGHQEFDRSGAVSGGPVPGGLQVEQLAMRQHDDAVVGFALLEIGRQPGELCVAQPGARIGNIVEHDEMHALVVERVMRRAEEFPVGLAGVERGIVLARHEAPSFTRNAETISRKRCMRARRSFGSSVVWVRSPVKTMKSGGLARPSRSPPPDLLGARLERDLRATVSEPRPQVRNQHRVVLSLWLAGAGGNIAPTVTQRDGFALAEWRQAGFDMRAVSDISPRRCPRSRRRWIAPSMQIAD